MVWYGVVRCGVGFGSGCLCESCVVRCGVALGLGVAAYAGAGAGAGVGAGAGAGTGVLQSAVHWYVVCLLNGCTEGSKEVITLIGGHLFYSTYA